MSPQESRAPLWATCCDPPSQHNRDAGLHGCHGPEVQRLNLHSCGGGGGGKLICDMKTNGHFLSVVAGDFS